MSPSYSREILPFPLRPHENADNSALCFQKSLLWGPFSEICFFGTRNHRLRVDRRLQRRKKKSSFSKISGSHFNQLEKHANRSNSSIASSTNSERWRNKKDIKHSRTTGAFRKNKTAPKLLTGAVIEYARNVCKPPAQKTYFVLSIFFMARALLFV